MFAKMLSRIIFILVLITTATPLIYQKKLFYAFESEKGLFFRFLIEIIVGLWLVLLLKSPEFRPKKTPINITIALFALILFIVDIFGVDTFLSVFSNFERMAGLILYLSIFGYFLVLSSIMNSPKRWLIFGIFLSVIAFIVSVKGIIQSYNRDEMIFNSGRVVATVGNANQLASYLILGFFVVALLISEWILPLRKNKKILANLYLLIALIFLIFYSVCLLKTSTRGALAGLILSGGLMLVLTFFKTSQRKFKVVAGVILTLIFIGISSLFYFRKSQFIQSNSSLNRITRITDEDGTNTFKSRLDNYQVAFDGIKAKQFLGWGQETYHYTYAQYFNPKLYADANWYDRVHNIILEWLIIGGFLGLMAYLSLWVAVLYQLWSKNNTLNISVKVILSGFLLAYFIGNLSLFDNLLSLMAFMSVIAFIENNSVKSASYQPYLFNNKMVLSGSVIMIILTIFTIKITCQQAFQTNKMIANAYNAGSLEEVIETYSQAYSKAFIGRQEVAEQLGDMASEIANNPIPEITKKRYFEVAKNIIKTEINHHPNYARLQIIYGNVLEAEGNLEEAIKTYQKVQILAPHRQSSLIQLSMLYAKNRQFDKSINLLQKTYLLEPINEEPRAYQAIVFGIKNDKINRDKIVSSLSEDALNKYIDKVKYAFNLTNDLDKFIKSVDKTSFKTTEKLYHEWATAAYSIKNYQESARAINTYRLHYWGYKFVDNRPLNIIYQDALNGKNPESIFEKAIE
jgi:O-antigen ligase